LIAYSHDKLVNYF